LEGLLDRITSHTCSPGEPGAFAPGGPPAADASGSPICLWLLLLADSHLLGIEPQHTPLVEEWLAQHDDFLGLLRFFHRLGGQAAIEHDRKGSMDDGQRALVTQLQIAVAATRRTARLSLSLLRHFVLVLVAVDVCVVAGQL